MTESTAIGSEGPQLKVPDTEKVNLLAPDGDFRLVWTPALWAERRFRSDDGQRLHIRQILPTVAPTGGLKRIHLVGSFDDSVIPGPRRWNEQIYARFHIGRPPENLAFHFFVIADDKDNILVALTTAPSNSLAYFETLYVHGENLVSELTPCSGYWDDGLWDAVGFWDPPFFEDPYDASVWLFEECRTVQDLLALEAQRVLLKISG